MPIICGVDVSLVALTGDLESLKAKALAMLSNSVATAAAEIGAQQQTFEATIRGWIPELPDLPVSPGTPMLPELLALATEAKILAENPDAVRGVAYAKAVEIFQDLYGDALSKAGVEFGYLINELNAGIDPCSLVPNIVVDSSGQVKDLVKEPLYAKVDPDPEEPSVETSEMVALRGKIGADLGDTISGLTTYSTAYAAQLPSITTEITNIKEALNKESISRFDYYNTVTKTINELSTSVVDDGHPADAKLVLDNIRQGSGLI